MAVCNIMRIATFLRKNRQLCGNIFADVEYNRNFEGRLKTLKKVGAIAERRGYYGYAGIKKPDLPRRKSRCGM